MRPADGVAQGCDRVAVLWIRFNNNNNNVERDSVRSSYDLRLPSPLFIR